MDTLEPVIDSLRIKDILHKLLKERFDRIDIAAAADEVRPFLRDPRELVLWSRELFKDLIAQVQSA